MYKPAIRSRHSSHKVLRQLIERLPVRSIIRFGSLTEISYPAVEINSISSIKISSDKKLMKEKFNEVNIRTALWVVGNTVSEIVENMQQKEITYPIIAKSRMGSRGVGNYFIDDEHNLRNWVEGRNLSNYIFERFYNYGLEFRLHITKNGCFYACRKALKKTTPQDQRWHRHIDNSVWLLETNENFNCPNSWEAIITDCVKALEAIKADVLSFDVRVQSKLTESGSIRKFQDYILIECNSASSMKSTNNDDVSICAKKYLEILPKLILDKTTPPN